MPGCANRVISIRKTSSSRRLTTSKHGRRAASSARTGAGGQGTVADAGEDAASSRHSRQDGPRRIHDRKSLLCQHAGPLRQRQPLSAQGQDRQAARRALPARPLEQRPVLRGKGQDGAERTRRWRREDGWSAPLSIAGPLPGWPAWAASSSTTTWSAMPTARRSPTAQASRRGGRTAVAELHGPANLEQHPRARFPDELAGRRSEAHRRHRRQRRRHADIYSLRRRRSAGGRVPGRHGLDGDAGRLRLRELLAICASAPATSRSPACSRPSRSA